MSSTLPSNHYADEIKAVENRFDTYDSLTTIDESNRPICSMVTKKIDGKVGAWKVIYSQGYNFSHAPTCRHRNCLECYCSVSRTYDHRIDAIIEFIEYNASVPQIIAAIHDTTAYRGSAHYTNLTFFVRGTNRYHTICSFDENCSERKEIGIIELLQLARADQLCYLCLPKKLYELVRLWSALEPTLNAKNIAPSSIENSNLCCE